MPIFILPSWQVSAVTLVLNQEHAVILNINILIFLNGAFLSLPPLHSAYADPEISDILAEFFSASFDQMKDIPLTGALRNEVLETIIKYFSIHLPMLKKINSLDVLKEIFN